MKINVSEIDDTEIQNALTLLQEYQTAVNNLKELEIKGADTKEIEDAKAKVDELATSISELPNAESIGITVEMGEDGKANIDSIKTQIANDVVKIPLGVDDKEVQAYEAPVIHGEAIYKPSFQEATPPTLYGTAIYRARVTGSTGLSATVNGTAHVDGTAFANGNWGTKGSGVALGGELGQETVVRNGRFFTIGDNGAEFFNYKKGDIIFNHKQTEELFKYGKVTSNNGRGKAFVNGTAFAEGNAFGYGSDGSGSNRLTISGAVTKNGSSGSGNDSDEDEFKEKFDWIEIAIDRIERAISSLDLKANSVYKSWSSRNENLKKEITEIGNEITLQQSGYERYMQEANSVGLSENWAKLVRDGTIDISTITDEDLAEKINEYSDWYNKAIDCRDAVKELKETESELYQQAFDNIVTQYEGMLSAIEYEKNMLDEYISQSEAKGYIISTSYYDALIKAEKSNIDQLEKEKDALYNSMQEAVNNGAIVEGSEAWYRNMPLYLVTGGGILFNC